MYVTVLGLEYKRNICVMNYDVNRNVSEPYIPRIVHKLEEGEIQSCYKLCIEWKYQTTIGVTN